MDTPKVWASWNPVRTHRFASGPCRNDWIVFSMSISHHVEVCENELLGNSELRITESVSREWFSGARKMLPSWLSDTMNSMNVLFCSPKQPPPISWANVSVHLWNHSCLVGLMLHPYLTVLKESSISSTISSVTCSLIGSIIPSWMSWLMLVGFSGIKRSDLPAEILFYVHILTLIRIPTARLCPSFQELLWKIDHYHPGFPKCHSGSPYYFCFKTATVSRTLNSP